MILNIPIDKIHPHPNNPRHDFGDLSELTDSIRANGILQPPTVMPYPNKDGECYDDSAYYTVIGHRRIAAAKEAGLAEVECYVVPYSNETSKQLAVALQENMHRQNLKPSEETHAVQMMLDLGDSVKDVAVKTGISEKKVRTRKKVAALNLDAANVDAACNRGACLDDFLRLAEIDDDLKRAEVLKSVGTPNFEMQLNQALSNQKAAQLRNDLLRRLETECRGGEVEDTLGLKYVLFSYFSTEQEIEQRFPKDTADTVYYYKTDDYGGITIYRDYTDDERRETEVRDAEEEQKAAIEHKLNELNKAAYECRRNFVLSFANAKKHAEVIADLMVNALVSGRATYNFKYGFDGYGGATDDVHKNLLVAWYVIMGDSEWSKYHTGMKWRQNERLDALYDALERLGYEMSDDEKALRDGTHDVFAGDDE